jgi:hypothetical protein
MSSLYVILSDGTTWTGLEGCRVVLSKDEDQVESSEYNPADFVEKSVPMESLVGQIAMLLE